MNKKNFFKSACIFVLLGFVCSVCSIDAQEKLNAYYVKQIKKLKDLNRLLRRNCKDVERSVSDARCFWTDQKKFKDSLIFMKKELDLEEKCFCAITTIVDLYKKEKSLKNGYILQKDLKNTIIVLSNGLLDKVRRHFEDIDKYGEVRFVWCCFWEKIICSCPNFAQQYLAFYLGYEFADSDCWSKDVPEIIGKHYNISELKSEYNCFISDFKKAIRFSENEKFLSDKLTNIFENFLTLVKDSNK